MVALIKCARGRITTYHDQDIGRGFLHNGIDIGHGDGTPADLRIGAPAAGRVTAVGKAGSYGLRIIIRHHDNTASLIAHLAEEFVERDQFVEQNQRIGTMGNSGTVYVHAHQEYLTDVGEAIDPLPYMTGTASTSNTIPVATTTEEDEMLIVVQSAHGVFSTTPGHVVSQNDPDYLEQAKAGYFGRAGFMVVDKDPTGEKLKTLLFKIAGFNVDHQVPGPGYAWHA